MSDPSTYPKCLIGSIVNPGEYWLINKREPHTSRIRQLEQDLSDEMAANYQIPHPDDINCEEYIAVEDPEVRGSWKRGRALCKIGKIVFKVFLIDSGCIIQVSVKHIRTSLHDDYKEVEPLAFRFCLRGIIPCSLITDEGRKQVSPFWTEESKYFVNGYISQNLLVHTKIFFLSKRTVIGDIFLLDERNQFFSLSRLLCSKNFALYSESYFREKVATTDPSVVDSRILELDGGAAFEMNSKMGRMEELRLLRVQLEGEWEDRPSERSEESDSDSQPKENEGLDKNNSNGKSRSRSRTVFKALSLKNKLKLHSKSNIIQICSRRSNFFPNAQSHRQVDVEGGCDQENQHQNHWRHTQSSEPSQEHPIPKRFAENQSSDFFRPRYTPKPFREKRTPRPFMENRTPKPFMENRTPKPFMENRTPKPFMENRTPKPFREKQFPKLFKEKEPSEPFREKHLSEPRKKKEPIQQLKEEEPSDLVREKLLLKTLKEKQALGGVERQTSLESSKEPSDAYEENEFSDGHEENEFSDEHEEYELLGECGENELLGECGENEHLEVPQDDEEEASVEKKVTEKSEEQTCAKPTEKEFKVVFEDKYPVTKLEPINYHEIFHIFFASVLRPIHKFQSLEISDVLFRQLERDGKFEEPSPIQKLAIPAILKGHDLVILGNPHTGKTLSYIIAFLEDLRQKDGQVQYGDDEGPLVLILSGATRTCEFIQRAFYLLTTRRSRRVRLPVWNLKIRFINGAISERNTVIQLVNDSDVLISTPHCFVRILKQRKLPELGRLGLIVIDEADMSTEEPFLTQLNVILHQTKIQKNTQKVFCAEKWTPELQTVANTFAKNHSVIIESLFEAGIYGNLRPGLIYTDDGNKDKYLLELVLRQYRHHKFAIVCSDSDEVIHIEKLFKQRSSCLIAHSTMLMQEIKDVNYKWKNSDKPGIVVCTDDIIYDLGINDADVLINYSLPSDWKISFSNRFLLVIKKLEDNFIEKHRRTLPAVFILLDNKNHLQLPHVFEFFQRLGEKFPQDFIGVCENIKMQIENSRKMQLLCDRILKFGKCTDWYKCQRRHIFVKDIDRTLKPLSGIVKLRILKVHSTSHLSVRLVELFDPKNNNKTVFEDFSLEITKRLRRHFYRKEHRKPANLITLNSLYALNRSDVSGVKYHRVKVIELKKFTASDFFNEVVVKLIDWGYVIQVHISKLFELPPSLRAYPPQSIDVYLCNLMPRDSDRDWSDRSISYAKNMFLRELEDNQIWVGRIKLSLNSMLFIDPLKLCRTLEDSDAYVVELSCCRKLVCGGIAEEDTGHLGYLYSLCEKANIDTSIYEYESDVVEDSPQPDCAFFDKNFLKVQFLSAESVSNIYVRVSKFKDLVVRLEQECDEEGKNQKFSNVNLLDSDTGKKITTGVCCLALYNSSWNRAKIYSLKNGKVEVFFIDYGDIEYVEELVPISDRLLGRLPAQAIECYLVGVSPQVEFTDDILDEIYNFSNNGVDELYVEVVEKKSKSQLTGGWKYGINLLDKTGKSLNKKLIDSGLVKPESNYEDLVVDVDIMSSDPETHGEIDSDTVDELNDSDEEMDPVGNADNTPMETDDLSYFLKMNSAVFDDENACFMLEEFVSLIAPKQLRVQGPKIEAKIEEEEEEAGAGSVPQNDGAVSREGETVDIVSQKNEGGSPDEEVADTLDQGDEKIRPEGEKSGTDSQIDEEGTLLEEMSYFSRRWKVKNCNPTLPYMKCFPDESKEDLKKYLLQTTFNTPEVLWSQTHSEVEVKIMLNNVSTYQLNCTPEKFIFRCVLDKKLYVSNVQLFGGVCLDMTRFDIKTFFVQIVFQKLCPLIWPRLCRENHKYRWIKYNIEHFAEKKCTIPEIICSQAIERIEAGDIVIPKVVNEIKYVPSSDSETSDWSESEDEDLSDRKEYAFSD